MTSDLDGDDPEYDLDPEDKDRAEAALRKSARELLKQGKQRERRKHSHALSRYPDANPGGRINEKTRFQDQPVGTDEGPISGIARA